MTLKNLTIATCQIPTSADVKQNAAHIRRYLRLAKSAGADLVHFGECALSGYCAIDFPTWEAYDWQNLRTETEGIFALCAELKLWAVMGSSHPLSHAHKPHNALYIVDERGGLVDRYDKHFCSMKDLNHYTPGNHATIFEVNGVRLGCAICLDYRFPEIYLDYMREGVHCVLHSFYDAGKSGKTLASEIVIPTLRAHAANSVMWISAPNCSRPYQTYPSVFINPDGQIMGACKRSRPGMIVNRIDLTSPSHYQMVRDFRAAAREGSLYREKRGKSTDDPRSRDRQTL